MTIREALKNVSPDKKLKVGSLQSFFYIGTVEDFKERMNDVSAYLYNNLKDGTAKKREVYEARLRRPPTIEKFCKECEMRSRQFTVDGYLEYLNFWLMGARELLNTYERSVQKEARFKPLSKRMVKERYMADEVVDPDTLILIVEGEDLGIFWTTGEAEPGSVGVGTPHEEKPDEFEE